MGILLVTVNGTATAVQQINIQVWYTGRDIRTRNLLIKARNKTYGLGCTAYRIFILAGMQEQYYCGKKYNIPGSVLHT